MRTKLRTLLRRDDDPVAAGPIPAKRTRPAIEIVAFAADCAVAARVRVEGERLSDALNGQTTFTVVDAIVESLEDGRSLEVAEVELQRDEILIVQIAGPRGDRERRVRTMPHRVEIQVGPYRVDGDLHVRPGVDPLRSFPRRREDLVPLTDATVTYLFGGQHVRHAFAAVAVNRSWVDWIAVGGDRRVPLEGPVMPTATGPLVKDFTGHVLG